MRCYVPPGAVLTVVDDGDGDDGDDAGLEEYEHGRCGVCR